MPWGDYGDTLFSGFLDEIDHNYNDLDIPKLERVGPYMPELYTTTGRNLVLVDYVKDLIERNNIKGVTGYRSVEKKKIVNIDWKYWDKDSKLPLVYPKSGEPADYIFKGKHDVDLANNMPNVWAIDLQTKYEMVKLSDKIDSINYTDIAFKEEPELDLFIPLNMGFVIASEFFKNLIEVNNIETVRFIKLQIL